MSRKLRTIFAACGSLSFITGLLALALLCCPRLFGMQSCEVQTGSMQPFVSPYDIAYVVPWRVRTGDVILFVSDDGSEVLHRVVSMRDGSIVTKGDANLCADADPICDSDVIGRMLFRVRSSDMDMLILLSSLLLVFGACLIFVGYTAPDRRIRKHPYDYTHNQK